MDDVVVVGAGAAGVTAAVSLASMGARVTVLEAQRVIGGRLRRLALRDYPDPVDFGQHLVVGSYRATRRLLETLHTADTLRPVEGHAPFFGPGGESFDYVPPSGAHRLDGLRMFLGFRQLRLRHRLGLLFPVVRAVSPLGQGLSVDEVDALTWLRRARQSEVSLEKFWSPLVSAALNTPLAEASAGVFAAMLRYALRSGSEALAPLLPGRAQTYQDILFVPASRYLTRHDCRVRIRTRVVGLECKGDRIHCARTLDGSTFNARFFILACDPWSLAGVLQGLDKTEPVRRRLNLLRPSPIVNLDIWYEEFEMPYPFVGFLDAPFHWAFRHRSASHTMERVSLVASHADGLIGLSNHELLQMAKTQLGQTLWKDASPRIVAAHVLRVRRATFRAVPGVQALRPGHETAYDNLFLAGDFTDVGLPATIEAAVLSGSRAAERVAGRLRRE